MIRVLIPSDKEFLSYKDECKKLYTKVQDKICDPNSFEFISTKTLFYMFIDDTVLVGAIYYFIDEDEKLFLNGFSKRKMFRQNLECLKLSTTWFNCDIYAEAQNRASALCLLKCGFIRLNNNTFRKTTIATSGLKGRLLS